MAEEGYAAKTGGHMMMDEITEDTRIIDLSVGQFLDIIKKGIEPHQQPKEEEQPVLPETRYVYGYDGLCELLHRSRATIWRVMKSGKLDAAIQQEGKQIRVDAELALKLYYDEKE